MMSMETCMRLAALHQRLIQATSKEINKNGHTSRLDASMEITMTLPGIYCQDSGIEFLVTAHMGELDTPKIKSIWSGKTPEEAISKAEDEIGEMVADSESEQLNTLAHRKKQEPL